VILQILAECSAIQKSRTLVNNPGFTHGWSETGFFCPEDAMQPAKITKNSVMKVVIDKPAFFEKFSVIAYLMRSQLSQLVRLSAEILFIVRG
jgi:hypothetical protein